MYKINFNNKTVLGVIQLGKFDTVYQRFSDFFVCGVF